MRRTKARPQKTQAASQRGGKEKGALVKGYVVERKRTYLKAI